jgi:hypothetical protein
MVKSIRLEIEMNHQVPSRPEQGMDTGVDAYTGGSV